MYRLNVRENQLDECVKSGMFALPYRSQIEVGEILLLQLRKTDWIAQGAVGERINWALVFQRYEYDEDGTISRQHWPNAGRTWPWIIYSSAVLEL